MFLGLSFVGIRAIMMDSNTPAVLGALRYGLAVLLLLPFVLIKGWPRIPPRVIAIVALLGVLQFGLFHIFVNTALQEISASRGAVIFALIPIMTTLIAAASGRDTLTIVKIAAAILSFVGVALAIGSKAFSPEASGQNWTGEILFFMAVSCGATYNAFSPRLLQHHAVLPLTIIGMTAGTLAVLTVAVPEGISTALQSYSSSDWLWIAYLAGPAAALSLFLFNWGLQQLSPSKAAIYVPLAPITAAAFGALLLGEHLSNLFLIGLACAAAGPALMNWRRPNSS
jgi:drug/metabolite transporter (DMT)-like permease